MLSKIAGISSALGLSFALALIFVPATAQAEVLSGIAKTLDGDSLIVGDKEVRLFGIDAPEFDQTCQRDGASWACGEEAKQQLNAIASGQRVECQGQGVDAHGRVLGVCSVGYLELNRTLVEQGWAIAYREGIRDAHRSSCAAHPCATDHRASRDG